MKREKKQVGQDQPEAPTAGELPENWMAPGTTLDAVFQEGGDERALTVAMAESRRHGVIPGRVCSAP